MYRTIETIGIWK